MKRVLLILIVTLFNVTINAQTVFDSKHLKISSESEQKTEKGELILTGDNKILYSCKIDSYSHKGNKPFYLNPENITAVIELENLTVFGNKPEDFIQNYNESNFNWTYNKSENKIFGKIKNYTKSNFKENIVFILQPKTGINLDKAEEVRVSNYLRCPENSIVCMELREMLKIDVKDLDKDNDGIINSSDNCPETANPDQEDHDKDGVGNVCDPDYIDVTLTSSDINKHIEFSSTSKIVSYKIFTLTGKVVKKGKLKANQTKIKVSKKMKRGNIYVIHFKSNKGITIKKKIMKL